MQILYRLVECRPAQQTVPLVACFFKPQDARMTVGFCTVRRMQHIGGKQREIVFPILVAGDYSNSREQEQEQEQGQEQGQGQERWL